MGSVSGTPEKAADMAMPPPPHEMGHNVPRQLGQGRPHTELTPEGGGAIPLPYTGVHVPSVALPGPFLGAAARDARVLWEPKTQLRRVALCIPH